MICVAKYVLTIVLLQIEDVPKVEEVRTDVEP